MSGRVHDAPRLVDHSASGGCGHAIRDLNLTEKITAIKVPTLIIVGEDDPGTPVAASQVINEKIKGSELVILKSAAHLSNIEQTEAFNKAVLKFLGKIGGKG